MRPPRSQYDRYIRLLLTALEERSLPTAGLSESLANGVLRVTDYRAGDAVAVHQTISGVTVDAGSDHQSFAAVNCVILDVQNGARVTNDVSGLHGAAAREVYLSRRDTSGAHFVFNGDLAAGTTSGPSTTPTTPSAPTPPTVPTPTPPPVTPPARPDWFDAAVTNTTLRTLARSDAADGTLSRSDWLQLFVQVEQDGTITAGEIKDLDHLLHPTQVTSSTAAGYTLPDSVRVLAGKVIDGDAANAHFQGAALGNLHSGSSATQLQELVGKWFLGSDHPVAAAGTTYRIVSGSLIVNGPSYSDVAQGQVGDCYFVAALAGVARFSPQIIQQMASDNGDGTFTIRFYHAGVADYVTVDRALATTTSGKAEYASFGGAYSSSGNELWVALIEKAYVQLNEDGWEGHPAANSYAAIDGGYSDAVITEVTGAAAGWTWITSATANTLISAIATGRPTVLSSRTTGSGNGVIDSHGYTLLGYNATTGRFSLYNPWGSTIDLTWGQIQQSFLGFWKAV
jgi:hypothetical protein